ncbi:MAG: DUF362 domain-containing protein [Firmicutes bacterium]|nr:DUF362 domain-containing protein [Bacillota bacterium]
MKKKLFKPRVLRKMVIAGTGTPRLRRNLLGKAGSDAPPEVYRLSTSAGLDQAVESLESLLQEKYASLISGKKVLLKYNLNTADPYPASVCPEMLRTVSNLLLRLGAREVIAGDCSGIPALPTKRQLKKAGLHKVLADPARLICFDNGPWVSVPVEGSYLAQVTVPRAALEAECIVALANLKTHSLALFTGALKLAVGFMHPLERYPLHREHLQEKVAEIGMAVQPDLVIMDARTVFITGGPAEGLAAAGETILVGDNALAVDAAAYGLLYRLKKERGCLEDFKEDPFTAAQLGHARDTGIWGRPWRGFQVIDR